MKRIVIAGLLSSLLTMTAMSLAAPPKPSTPRKFSVGVGAVTSGGRVVRGATAPGGTLTVARSTVCLQSDGSQQATIIYTNGANANVSQRSLFIDAACTKVIDSFGGVVSATGPAAECSAASSFLTQFDSTLNTAATGGKLNL